MGKVVKGVLKLPYKEKFIKRETYASHMKNLDSVSFAKKKDVVVLVTIRLWNRSVLSS